MSTPSLDFSTYDLHAHMEPEESVKDLLKQRKVKKESKMGLAKSSAAQYTSLSSRGNIQNQAPIMHRNSSRRRIQLPEKTLTYTDENHNQTAFEAAGAVSEYQVPSTPIERRLPKIDSLETTLTAGAGAVSDKQKPQIRMLRRHWQSKQMKKLDERKDQYASMASEFGRYVQGFESVCSDEQKEAPIPQPQKLLNKGSHRFTFRDAARLPKLKTSQRYASNLDIEQQLNMTKSQARGLVLQDSTLAYLNVQQLPSLRTARNNRKE